jgi:ferredoxin
MRQPHYALVIDPVACDGSGVCAELLPEYIRLDPWGYPIIEAGEIAPHLLEHAERAVRSCPRLALTLVRSNSPATRH